MGNNNKRNNYFNRNSPFGGRLGWYFENSKFLNKGISCVIYRYDKYNAL